MKNLILTLIITLPLILWGQGWEQTFGGEIDDFGSSVQQTTDGGYIITGSTSSFGNGSFDIYLLKTDNNGNELWFQTFGNKNNYDGEHGSSVQQTIDGGYIITGSVPSDLVLIKTDENGNEQWSKTFGGESGDVGYSVQQTTDGGYIITGSTFSWDNEIGVQIYLIKTDENGTEQWSKTFGGVSDDVGFSVQQTSDGGFIITGRTSSFGNGLDDVWLIKTDENGNEQWSKTFGGNSSDVGHSVQQTTDGGYIITGETFSFGNGGSDVYLIKTDGNGNEQWSQTFGDESLDHGYSVQQTIDGGFITTGFTLSYENGLPDIYLIKTDGSGNEQWSKTFGGNSSDVGRSVQQTTDGGYIITGETFSFGNGTSDVYLIKTDDQGNITSTFEIPLPNSNRKLEKTVNLKGQEIKPKTNQPIIEIFDDGSVEKIIVE